MEYLLAAALMAVTFWFALHAARQRRRVRDLEALTRSLSYRLSTQSELLGRAAERQPNPGKEQG